MAAVGTVRYFHAGRARVRHDNRVGFETAPRVDDFVSRAGDQIDQLGDDFGGSAAQNDILRFDAELVGQTLHNRCPAHVRVTVHAADGLVDDGLLNAGKRLNLPVTYPPEGHHADISPAACRFRRLHRRRNSDMGMNRRRPSTAARTSAASLSDGAGTSPCPNTHAAARPATFPAASQASAAPTTSAISRSVAVAGHRAPQSHAVS